MNRRLLLRCCALLLAWQMMPGTGELLENVLHLVREGHLAHALPDADHQREEAEHNCSGPYHFCPCHSGTSFVVAQAKPWLALPAYHGTCPHSAEGDGASGHGTQVFRPPIAA